MRHSLFGPWANAFRLRVAACLIGAVLGALPHTASAATDWPTKPVTMLVPFPPGGFTDMMARMLADSLTRKFGQTFIVDNRPGAGGALAAGQLARAKADGYTLMFGSAGQLIVVPMMQKVSYDPDRSIVPISIFGVGPMVLGVRQGIPVTDLTSLIAYAKANPGKLNVSSGGPGTIGHLTAVLFAKRAGLDVVMVPYKGGGQNVNALLSGEADMYFGNASELVQQKSRLTLLATSTASRIPSLPDVPTVDSMFPGFELAAWNGLLGPAGLPDEVMSKIEKAAIEAAREPLVVERLVTLGILPAGSTAAELAATIAKEKLTYREALDAAGIVQEQ